MDCRACYWNSRAVHRFSVCDTSLAAAPPPAPRPNNTAIARYLDHIDRRIQRYIQAKEKRITLLHEARQATIHRAVTRGLDPDVPLKPSGVDWLGEVPAHWEVRTVKVYLSLRNGDVTMLTKHTKEGELPVQLCNYVDVYNELYRITKSIAFMPATNCRR